MRLAGRTAIVTGGASGIGFSFAERFVAEGAKVVIADVRGAGAAAESLGGKDTCMGIEADVASEDSVRRMIDATLAQFGQLDILISVPSGRRKCSVMRSPATTSVRSSRVRTLPTQFGNVAPSTWLPLNSPF